MKFQTLGSIQNKNPGESSDEYDLRWKRVLDIWFDLIFSLDREFDQSEFIDAGDMGYFGISMDDTGYVFVPDKYIDWMIYPGYDLCLM